MKYLAILLVCAGVIVALFANRIDIVAQQSIVIKIILTIAMVILALFVLLLVIKLLSHM